MNMPQSPQARISQRGRPRNHGGGRGAGGQGGGNIGSVERDPSSIGPLTEVKLIAQLILCDADCSRPDADSKLAHGRCQNPGVAVNVE